MNKNNFGAAVISKGMQKKMAAMYLATFCKFLEKALEDNPDITVAQLLEDTKKAADQDGLSKLDKRIF